MLLTGDVSYLSKSIIHTQLDDCLAYLGDMNNERTPYACMNASYQ